MSDDKPGIIYVDCSATVYSGLNTGIQRVVRNVVKWSNSENNKNHKKVVPVVVLWGLVFEVAPEIVQINSSKLISFGSQTKLRIESARAKVRKNNNKANFFGKFFLEFFEKWDRFLRLCYRVLKYTRVSFFVFKSGPKFITPGPNDTFLFLDSFWLLNLPMLFKRGLKNCKNKIIVIYDIIPLIYPEIMEEEGRKLFTKEFDYLIRQVDAALTISNSVTNQVVAYLKSHNYGLEKLNINHFYLGADFKPFSESVKEKVRQDVKNIIEGSDSKIWLMVGTIEPRKNHAFVLDAFETIWAEGASDRLVIVGRVGWKCDDIIGRIQNHKYFGTKLIYLKDLSDDELQYCYSQARALIFASKTEGFGLPLVEAMFYKIPVLCSDIPVFREIGESYPQYFSLENKQDIVNQIKNFSKQKNQAVNQSAFLTWKESTRLLIEKLNN